MTETSAQQRLQRRLKPVIELLDRQRLEESVVKRREGPRQALAETIVQRQQLAALRSRLAGLHPGDLAHLLEMLTPENRVAVWEQIPDAVAGEVLWEVLDTVADSLVERTPHDRLVAMCAGLSASELAQLSEHLPEDVIRDVQSTLEPGPREWLKTASRLREGSVGHAMSDDVVSIAQDATVRKALRSLRKLPEMPSNTDKLVLVDDRQRVTGTLDLGTLLTSSWGIGVADLAEPDPITFNVDDEIDSAAQDFERYDLVSAPVLDSRGKLVGRLTVDAVMDFVRERAEGDALKREGLSADEELLGPIWGSARRRWLWLSINLCTAFMASRVIGLFDDTIEQLVALATLTPIVASIAGNTGNQTVALVVRGLALDQISTSNIRYLATKEFAVSIINGVLWGSVIGVVVMVLYQNVALGLVLTSATLINLMAASLVGIAVPIALTRLGRDPALGSSVVLTFIVDSMGFFAFLALASVALV